MGNRSSSPPAADGRLRRWWNFDTNNDGESEGAAAIGGGNHVRQGRHRQPSICRTSLMRRRKRRIEAERPLKCPLENFCRPMSGVKLLACVDNADGNSMMTRFLRLASDAVFNDASTSLVRARSPS